jgi:hypothetical protein
MNALAPRIAWMVALGLCTVASCSNQGEGDRCDARNGDGDCADGLICRTVPGRLDSQYCCPPGLGQSSAPQCSSVFVYDAGATGAAGAAGAAGSPIPDASSDAATVPDGQQQPSADAPPETGSSDAADDASVDATTQAVEAGTD